MKLMICCLLLLPFTLCFSQTKSINFSAIDWRVENIESTSPDTLAKLLTEPYTTDLEKVRSIFRWITEHIEYNTLRFQPYRTIYHDDGIASEDDSLPGLRSLDERVARIVLKRKQTVCAGYARLFKALCDFAGIKSEIITGYAKTNMSALKQFKCNHNWNAVFIDSNWYLLDVTWASGYLSFSGTEFIKDYNDYYFLTPPKYFIEDHYPEDVRWTLLNNPPTISEFNNSPFKLAPFNRYKIISYSPAKGIIYTHVGDSIKIELQTDDEMKTLSLTDITSPDSVEIAAADSSSLINKTAIVNGNNISCTYYAASQSPQWLQVIYKGDVILRYKLNIEKEPFNFPSIKITDIVAKN
jgi:transglutaminase/protease-like cytokinesis protein 3